MCHFPVFLLCVFDIPVLKTRCNHFCKL